MRAGTDDAGASELDAVLARYIAGDFSPQMAMMNLLIESESYEDALGAIEAAERESESWNSRRSAARERMSALSNLARTQKEGCERIAVMLRSDMDSSAPARSVDEGIEFCRRLFDWSVGQSEEASVALYSLGSPELLSQATTEIVDQLECMGVLGPDRDILQIGCGIGRIEAAVAGKVRLAVGVDVSAGMIEAARRRCSALPNVHLEQCTGRDLASFGDTSFDLVYAVDTFPYLVQTGAVLTRQHFDEAHRILRARGDFIILNFSYRGDISADVADVSALATACGFDVVVSGTQPLRIWNGVLFHLRNAGLRADD